MEPSRISNILSRLRNQPQLRNVAPIPIEDDIRNPNAAQPTDNDFDDIQWDQSLSPEQIAMNRAASARPNEFPSIGSTPQTAFHPTVRPQQTDLVTVANDPFGGSANNIRSLVAMNIPPEGASGDYVRGRVEDRMNEAKGQAYPSESSLGFDTPSVMDRSYPQPSKPFMLTPPQEGTPPNDGDYVRKRVEDRIREAAGKGGLNQDLGFGQPSVMDKSYQQPSAPVMTPSIKVPPAPGSGTPPNDGDYVRKRVLDRIREASGQSGLDQFRPKMNTDLGFGTPSVMDKKYAPASPPQFSQDQAPPGTKFDNTYKVPLDVPGLDNDNTPQDDGLAKAPPGAKFDPRYVVPPVPSLNPKPWPPMDVRNDLADKMDADAKALGSNAEYNPNRFDPMAGIEKELNDAGFNPLDKPKYNEIRPRTPAMREFERLTGVQAEHQGAFDAKEAAKRSMETVKNDAIAANEPPLPGKVDGGNGPVAGQKEKLIDRLRREDANGQLTHKWEGGLNNPSNALAAMGMPEDPNVWHGRPVASGPVVKQKQLDYMSPGVGASLGYSPDDWAKIPEGNKWALVKKAQEDSGKRQNFDPLQGKSNLEGQTPEFIAANKKRIADEQTAETARRQGKMDENSERARMIKSGIAPDKAELLQRLRKGGDGSDSAVVAGMVDPRLGQAIAQRDAQKESARHNKAVEDVANKDAGIKQQAMDNATRKENSITSRHERYKDMVAAKGGTPQDFNRWARSNGYTQDQIDADDVTVGRDAGSKQPTQSSRPAATAQPANEDKINKTKNAIDIRLGSGKEGVGLKDVVDLSLSHAGDPKAMDDLYDTYKHVMTPDAIKKEWEKYAKKGVIATAVDAMNPFGDWSPLDPMTPEDTSRVHLLREFGRRAGVRLGETQKAPNNSNIVKMTPEAQRAYDQAKKDGKLGRKTPVDKR